MSGTLPCFTIPRFIQDLECRAGRGLRVDEQDANVRILSSAMATGSTKAVNLSECLAGGGRINIGPAGRPWAVCSWWGAKRRKKSSSRAEFFLGHTAVPPPKSPTQWDPGAEKPAKSPNPLSLSIPSPTTTIQYRQDEYVETPRPAPIQPFRRAFSRESPEDFFFDMVSRGCFPGMAANECV